MRKLVEFILTKILLVLGSMTAPSDEFLSPPKIRIALLGSKTMSGRFFGSIPGVASISHAAGSIQPSSCTYQVNFSKVFVQLPQLLSPPNANAANLLAQLACSHLF